MLLRMGGRFVIRLLGGRGGRLSHMGVGVCEICADSRVRLVVGCM